VKAAAKSVLLQFCPLLHWHGTAVESGQNGRSCSLWPLGQHHPVWRKAAKVCACLHAALQLIKLPKLLMSVALAPISGCVLQFCQK
jgi:hypothetical protein